MPAKTRLKAPAMMGFQKTKLATNASIAVFGLASALQLIMIGVFELRDSNTHGFFDNVCWKNRIALP